MPRTKTHPSQLGKVVNTDGKFCARVLPRDVGQARDFTGPRHDDGQDATDDLLAIRAAGAEHTTRVGALEAMRQAANSLKDQAKAGRGGLEYHGGEIRARIQYNEDDVERNIRGPRRIEERHARADLEAICAAGENKPTRAEYLEAMQTEALRICNIMCFLCV